MTATMIHYGHETMHTFGSYINTLSERYKQGTLQTLTSKIQGVTSGKCTESIMISIMINVIEYHKFY